MLQRKLINIVSLESRYKDNSEKRLMRMNHVCL